MAYDIKMVKLATGELALGKHNKEKKCLEDVAIVQTIPQGQSVQMLLLPYGYPFDEKFDAIIDEKNIIYTYKNLPAELETKYIEACTNLTLNPGSLGKLSFGDKNIVQ